MRFIFVNTDTTNTKIMVKLFWVFILSTIVVSCNRSDSNNSDLSTEELQKEIIAKLSRANGKKFKFVPKDTLIDLGDNMKLAVFKNSFLLPDSSVFDKEVEVDFQFLDAQEDIISALLNFPDASKGVSNIMGMMNFTVKGCNGEKLKLNPDYQPVLNFPSYARMLKGMYGKKAYYFTYDSVKNTYSEFLEDVSEVFNDRGNLEANKNKDKKGEGYPYEIDLDLMLVDSAELNKVKGRKYGAKPTNLELIGYEITLKTMGYYFIGWDDKEMGLQPVDINLMVSNLAQTIGEDGYLKVFLFTPEQVSKKKFSSESYHYLIGRKVSNGNYKIEKPENMYLYSTLHLPLERKFTLFCYGINNGKYYCSVLKNIKLKNSNDLKINLENVELDVLIKKIQDL